MSLCLQQASKCGSLGCNVLTCLSIQCRAVQKLQVTSIGPKSSCSIIGQTVVGPQSSCFAIGWTIVSYSCINMGSCGWIDIGGRSWIDTGGIREETAAETAAEVVGCRKSIKGHYWDHPFLFSYI